MKNVITVSAANVTFELSARLTSVGVPFAFAGKQDETKHNKFSVTIKTENGKASFPFYCSQLDYIKGIKTMSESDLKHALYCIVSDSLSGVENTFEQFCSEFGYDTDSRNAERIYKSCKKIGGKLYPLIAGADICDIVNELND